MLQVLRQAPDSGHIHLPSGLKKDINWFNTSLSTFNGIVMFPQTGLLALVIFVDSSLYVLGGYEGPGLSHLPLPDSLARFKLGKFLELLNIHVALQL